MAVSHWHLSIWRAGGKETLLMFDCGSLKTTHLTLLIPCCLGQGEDMFFKQEIGNIYVNIILLQGVDLVLDDCQCFSNYLNSC